MAKSNDWSIAVQARFAEPTAVDGVEAPDLVRSMVHRGSCRRFTDTPIAPEVLNLLCAAAMSAPTKSDLQQRDIIVLQSAELRRAVSALVPGQVWIADAPLIVVFCGNNRRQRLLHDWQGVPFANDHLDAFFNAAGDAAIALGAFVTAAEALGLGCCPVSAVRNEAQAVSDMLGLPDHVFPFAGLALGHPAAQSPLSMRLPLSVNCHIDGYCEDNLQETVSTYDQTRAKAQPYAAQRMTDTFGESSSYCWSEDKVRQYSLPERANFGDFVRRKGFRLD